MGPSNSICVNVQESEWVSQCSFHIKEQFLYLAAISHYITSWKYMSVAFSLKQTYTGIVH